MYRNSNYDPVTERLTLITIGKLTLLDQYLSFVNQIWCHSIKTYFYQTEYV